MGNIKDLILGAYLSEEKHTYLSLFSSFMEDGKARSKKEIASFILTVFVDKKIGSGVDVNTKYFDRWSRHKVKTIVNQVNLLVSNSKHKGAYTNNLNYEGRVVKIKEGGVAKYKIVKEDSL